jgi:hypothetical protein
MILGEKSRRVHPVVFREENHAKRVGFGKVIDGMWRRGGREEERERERDTQVRIRDNVDSKHLKHREVWQFGRGLRRAEHSAKNSIHSVNPFSCFSKFF